MHMVRFLEARACVHCGKRVTSYWLVTDAAGEKHVVCATCVDLRRKAS